MFDLVSGDAVVITSKMENSGSVLNAELMKLGIVANVPKRSGIILLWENKVKWLWLKNQILL